MFFKSVAATVSTFSPLEKAQIKAEVMSLVSRYENEQVIRQAIPTGSCHNQLVNDQPSTSHGYIPRGSHQNQLDNDQPFTSHGYNSPPTSHSADGNFHSHGGSSYCFSPEPENQNIQQL